MTKLIRPGSHEDPDTRVFLPVYTIYVGPSADLDGEEFGRRIKQLYQDQNPWYKKKTRFGKRVSEALSVNYLKVERSQHIYRCELCTKVEPRRIYAVLRHMEILAEFIRLEPKVVSLSSHLELEQYNALVYEDKLSV